MRIFISRGRLKIRIVTVNVPESYLNAIEKLVGKSGMYPSRSELVRVATKEFLVRELEAMKSFSMFEEVGKEEKQRSPKKENAPVRIKEGEVPDFLELLDVQDLELVEEPNLNKS